MPMSRRTALALFAASPVIAVAAPSAAREPLVLERFFKGRTTGTGIFESGLLGIKRPFTVVAEGRQEGDSFILTEKIAYEDGVRDTAIWRFRPAGSGYDGTRTGVQGLVNVKREDGVISMAYVAEVPGSDGAMVKLRFEDILEQTDARTVVNTARVSYLGITVGRVEVTFNR